MSFVNIKSVDRDSGSSHAFRYTLNNPVQRASKITLLNVELPLTMYTVRSGYNATFVFTRSSTTYTATVSEGVYTVTTLLTALASAMNSADSSTTFSFSTSSVTNKITMTASNSVTIASDTYLSKQLGFVSSQSGTSITATNAYNITDMFFFIRFSNLPTNLISKVPASFRIQITQDLGYVQYYEPESTSQQHIDLDGNTTVNHLDIALVDLYGNTVSLNGCEWSLLLRVD